MPGSLDANFRRGHLAEVVGVWMMGAFCSVVQVPQEEDFGLDAIATILRRDGRSLYPEDSFCIQFKAASIRKIEYKPKGYIWLGKLTIPLFIGSVDLTTQEVSLYTTHHIICQTDFDRYHSVVMHLDECPDRDLDGVLHRYLGRPVLRWTSQDGESKDFQKQAYAVLKTWMSLEQNHYSLRCIKMTPNDVSWETNEIPEASGFKISGHPDNMKQDMEAASPYLCKIGSHLMSGLFFDDPPRTESILFAILACWFVEQGAKDLDIFVKMFRAKFFQGQESLQVSIQLGDD